MGFVHKRFIIRGRQSRCTVCQKATRCINNNNIFKSRQSNNNTEQVNLPRGARRAGGPKASCRVPPTEAPSAPCRTDTRGVPEHLQDEGRETGRKSEASLKWGSARNKEKRGRHAQTAQTTQTTPLRLGQGRPHRKRPATARQRGTRTPARRLNAPT